MSSDVCNRNCRHSSPHNRAKPLKDSCALPRPNVPTSAFRLVVLLMALVAASSGQWLEGTVFIPDSFGGLRMPNFLAFDATDNRVFVAGALTRTILVLDGTDGHRLGRIPFQADVSALCYNPLGNRIYAAAADRNAVAVIDAAAMQVVTTVSAGTNPCALTYDPTSNKVYCVNTSSHDVTVIDGAGDSVVTTVQVGQDPSAACWNTTRNVVYVANSNSNDVTVIDAAADTVVTTIAAGYLPSGLVYNPDLNKLYEADFASGAVTVIDGLADRVLGTVPGGTSPKRLCYNPANSKVYVANQDNDIMVIDCTADTLLRYVGSYASDVAYDSADNRIYAADGTGIAVIDGATDELLAEVGIGHGTVAVCLADSGRRAFAAADGDDVVGVVDCAADSLIAAVGTDVRLSALCLNLAGNKVYCADSSGRMVTVIDARADTISAAIPVRPHPVALLHDPNGNKIYCSSSGDDSVPAALTAIDGSRDSVLRTITTGLGYRIGGQALCLNSTNNRVYAGVYSDNAVAVVDATADSVVAKMQAGGNPVALCYGLAYNYVYAGIRNSAVGVFDCDANVMIARPATNGTPVALVYDPVGAKVYTANGSTGVVSVIAGESPAVTAEIQACSWASAVCLSTKENRVYCADQEGGNVAVIDASADSVMARVPVGDQPSALSYDSFNNYVYCACRGSNDVYVIDSHRNNVVKRIGVDAEPFALAWDPFRLRTYVLNYLGSSVSVLRDSLHPGVQQTMNDERRGMNGQATVVRGVLFLPELGTRSGSPDNPILSSASLLDAAGRTTMGLKPGANDVSRLAPGVYFVRSEASAISAGSSAVTKVVVTR